MPIRAHLPARLKEEIKRRLDNGETVDALYAYAKEQGWSGARATLASRLAEMRSRPEEELAQQLAQGVPAEPAEPEPEQEDEPEIAELSAKKPRDTLADLREAQTLMRALAQRAVAALKKGKGSEGLALKAIDSYAALTLKIRRLERDEKPKTEKAYKIVEARFPPKSTVQ